LVLSRVSLIGLTGLEALGSHENGCRLSSILSRAERDYMEFERRPHRSLASHALKGNLVQDIGYSLRTLVRNPGFTIVTLLTLALGIGANTAMFSVLQGVVLSSLPFPESNRLVFL
jgi:hypothetical protein